MIADPRLCSVAETVGIVTECEHSSVREVFGEELLVRDPILSIGSLESLECVSAETVNDDDAGTVNYLPRRMVGLRRCPPLYALTRTGDSAERSWRAWTGYLVEHP